jgi:hypothetical protein
MYAVLNENVFNGQSNRVDLVDTILIDSMINIIEYFD